MIRWRRPRPASGSDPGPGDRPAVRILQPAVRGEAEADGAQAVAALLGDHEAVDHRLAAVDLTVGTAVALTFMGLCY